MIKLVNVSKFYNSNDVIALGLRSVNLELNVNEFVAVIGESGSGKTTLLNVITGIDTYEDGEMYVNGQETSYFSVSDMENYRKKYVAFVFQDYNLIDSYTVLQNVEAPLLLSGYPKEKIRERALELIKKVGLEKHVKHKATKLSGGQKQRVVIARALAKDCPIIAADEPTGNLDSESAKQIIKLLADISKEKLVIMVTHDFSQVENYATRKIRIYDGEIVEDKELLKTEKKNLPTLEDKEFKMDFLSMLKLSLRNLLSVPKKTFLMAIVFSFFAVFIGLSYGGYILVANETSYPYSSHFQYTNPDRLVVKRSDNQPLTADDISELEDLSNVKMLVERDYVLDVNRVMSSVSGKLNYIGVAFLPLSYLDDDIELDFGTMPVEDNQIILAVDPENYDYKSELIGEELTQAYDWYPDSNYYEVVGVVKNDIVTSNQRSYQSYAFVSDKLWQELAETLYLNNYGDANISVEGKVNKVRIYNNNFVIDNSLADNRIRLSYNYYNYLCPDFSSSCNVVGTLEINDYYVSETYDYDIAVTTQITGNEIHVNENTYKRVFYEDIYQVTIFTENDINVENLMKTIARQREGLNFKYKVIYPYDSQASNEFEGILLMIQNFGMIMLIVVTIAGSTLITYIIFKAIINTKLHDYAIFRTIGANQKVIKGFIYLENFYITIIAFIVFLVLSLAMPSDLPEYSPFLAFKVFTFDKYIVYFGLLVIMSLIVSRRYTNRIFSSSVSKTLKTDLE
jgi:ABC-type lipoprotein export system ATPase subunit